MRPAARVCGCLGLLAFPSVQLSSAQTFPAAIPPEMKSLTSDLASENFSKREAAVRRLNAFGWRHLDVVRAAASAAPDIEAQAALTARVKALEDFLSLNPTPYTADVRDATLFRAGLALEGSNPLPLKIREADEKYSLKVSDASLTQVLGHLYAQHPFHVDFNAASAARWTIGPPRSDTFFSFADGAGLCLSMLPSGPQPPRPAMAYVGMQFFIDPRVRMADVDFHILQADDADGKPLGWNVVPPPFGFTPANRTRGAFYLIETKYRKALETSQLRLAATITVAVTDETLTVRDLPTQVGKQFSLHSPASLTLAEFNATADSLSLVLTRSHSREKALAAGANLSDYLLSVRLLDANGNEVSEMTGERVKLNATAPKKLPYQAPFRLVISRPSRALQLKTTFTFSNIKVEGRP
jgi:hypothetical protein